MSHQKRKSDQIVFKFKPVCEKLNKETVGQKLDEIKFEEIKLVANYYPKLTFASYIYGDYLLAGFVKFIVIYQAR